MNSISKIFLYSFLLLASTTGISRAEQGCPPGQYPIGGQGVAACAPIPQENSAQESRPLGKWINTWGAIASDGGDNLGVSTGERKKTDAQNSAVSKCKELSKKDCKVEFTYYNQCSAIAEPYINDKAIPGTMAYAGAPNTDAASENALSLCKKENLKANCRIIYKECSKPIFKKY
ncbi:DUF4189 domain-containing protein [Xanthomonas vesicatoria]|uniref:DUF4189 domain-containing protein n=1 Tax=Xanthomonas vesicatoria TaxID=56460 RepID=UPI001E5BB446|nr:DUF4189 domain-containing protein [Xanthomonas vesicatoria]MCC8626056.1 DUF4189 domain-containing protein [Xanthomonas vesicatoria]MDG4482710.1 DUF4189 domain-containing protein [Xanthomonas vesicatoria]